MNVPRFRVAPLAACIAAAVLFIAPASVSAQQPTTTRTRIIAFASLSAGHGFSCGLSFGGTAYCWGIDDLGQLGVGGIVGRCDRNKYVTGPCARAPVEVAGNHEFVSISAGDGHACAVDIDGRAWCWGNNQINQLGVSGAEETCAMESSARGEAMSLPCTRTPTLVPFLSSVTAIATGESLTCAVDGSGRAWCWPLGRERSVGRVAIDRPLASIAVRGEYACGLTVDSRIRCWSWPEDAESGATAPSDESGWSSLTVGVGYACALDADSLAWCWGNDADGALGRGHTGHKKLEPLPIGRVLGGHRFASIAAGTLRTCAIDGDGALYCWGRVPDSLADDQCLDSNGVAGDNDCTSTPALVQRGTRFRSISIGGSHQCAISTSGQALCWGTNAAGELGNGTLRSSIDVTDVRTRGITPRRAMLLDLREFLGLMLAAGGFALIVVLGLAIHAPGWTAAARPLWYLAALWGGAVLVTLLLAVATMVGVGNGYQMMFSDNVMMQPLMIALGLTIHRVAVDLRGWWRRGSGIRGGAEQTATSAPVAGPAPVARSASVARPTPLAMAARGFHAWGGVAALVTVVVGWVPVFLAATARPTGTGEMALWGWWLGLLVGAGITLAAAAIAAVASIVILRRNRRSVAAIIALPLAILTLVAGAIMAARVFWTR